MFGKNLRAGESATAESISGTATGRERFQAFRVPAEAIRSQRRLIRDCAARARSRVSRPSPDSLRCAMPEFELDAASCGSEPRSSSRSRTAASFTRSASITRSSTTGAQAASPLLFPETVFNAPASHLAAILGITGASYTIVGDGAVGLLALKMAEDLMANPALDRCLVVGAEEADWLLCDAYRRWRLLREAPPIEPFGQPARHHSERRRRRSCCSRTRRRSRSNAIDAGGNFPASKRAR